MAGTERERTYGVVGFVLVFVAMAGLGLLAVLTLDNPRGPTEIVATPQTPPSDPPGGPTFPDGSPAPAGVDEVLVEDGVIVLSFDVPESMGVTDRTPEVPALTAEAVGEDRLSIRIGCGRSSDEVLVRVAVTESPDSLTVLAVTTAPEDGAPCDASAQPTVLDVPLSAPIAGRPIVVVPAGSVPVPMGGR